MALRIGFKAVESANTIFNQTDWPEGGLKSFAYGEISECAWFLMTGGDLYKGEGEIQPERLQQKLPFPFLTTSFLRMNENTSYDKAYAQHAQHNSENKGELFKEITSQADSKDGFSKIADKLGDEFSAAFIDNIHCLKFTTEDRICQGIFS